jgi:hypothetical protein
LACDVALHHHERWDGKGYPEGRPAQQESDLPDFDDSLSQGS